MSKPHVWVVEEFYNGKWCINQIIDTGYLAALRALKHWISCNDGAQFRVAKYVRVEPTAKRRKGK